MDNIKQVVKDVRFLIATDCCDETIQSRIENFINERDEALAIFRENKFIMKKHIKEMIRNARKEMWERCSKVDCEITIKKECEYCKDLGGKYVGVALGYLRCPVCGKM